MISVISWQWSLRVLSQAVIHNRPQRFSNTKPFLHSFPQPQKQLKHCPSHSHFSPPPPLTARRKQGASDTFRSVISVSLTKVSIPVSEVLTNLVLSEVLLDVGEGFITHPESVRTKLEQPAKKRGREAVHRSAFLSQIFYFQIEPQMVWVGSDLTDNLVPSPLPRTGSFHQTKLQHTACLTLNKSHHQHLASQNTLSLPVLPSDLCESSECFRILTVWSQTAALHKQSK